MTNSAPRPAELTAAACRACGACCSFSYGTRPKTDAACPAYPGGQPTVRCYCSGKCRHQSTRSPSFPMLAFLRAGSTPSTRYQPPLVTIVTRATHSEPKAVALPIHSLRERKNYTKASLFMRETFFVGSHCPRCPPALVSPSAAALYSAVIDLRPVSPETD